MFIAKSVDIHGEPIQVELTNPHHADAFEAKGWEVEEVKQPKRLVKEKE